MTAYMPSAGSPTLKITDPFWNAGVEIMKLTVGWFEWVMGFKPLSQVLVQV